MINDGADWAFIQTIDPNVPYDLAAEMRTAFKSLQPYREEIESLIRELEDDAYFSAVELNDLLALVREG